MHSIETYLDEIGLSPSETTLYLAGLRLGKTGVKRLVNETGVKRPTAYHALNELVAKGLAKETKEGRELVYSMSPPSEITGYIHSMIGDLSAQERKLEELLPLFPSSISSTKAEASIREFSGREEVEHLIDLALYCKKKQWDIIAPKDNFIAGSDMSYIEYFKKTRSTQAIISRSLWEEKLSRRQLNLRDIVSRKPRYLPKEYRGTFKSMMILFDTSIALIGSHEHPQGLLIESAEYHALMQILFDGMWVRGEKP